MKLLLLPVVLTLWHLHLAAQMQKTAVYFVYNEYRLNGWPDSLTQMLKQAERITLRGHCDSTGSDAYNKRLSEQRVQTVHRLLDSLLQPAAAITTQALGEQEPAAPNLTAEGRQLNRRVEIWYTLPEKPPAPEPPPAIKPETTLEKAIQQTETGGTLTLPNLHFRGAMHRLLPGSVPVLEELLQVMRSNAALEIDIQGHICCVNGEEDAVDIETNTRDLSVQRAKAVYEYLVANGIPALRMHYRGFGHKFPLTAERTTYEQEQNRRVEIKILKK